MNEDLINLLMDHADDPSLSCLLLHGVCRSLEYLRLKKVDVTSVINESKKTAVKELLDADSPGACQLAAMVLEMLNHGSMQCGLNLIMLSSEMELPNLTTADISLTSSPQ